ncbi:MAG: hypothetical protein QW815_03075 [Nitrososphaerota archaeon]
MSGLLQVLPVITGLFGAISQQQQASAAAGMSKEALELQKKIVDAYLKEYEEMRPYREGLRKLGAYMLGQKPYGWEQWTSSPWRLSSLPPAQTLIQLGQIPITTTPPTGNEEEDEENKEEEKKKKSPLDEWHKGEPGEGIQKE